MDKSVNEEWYDALIRYQIGLLRYAQTLINNSVERLDETELALAGLLLKYLQDLQEEKGYKAGAIAASTLAALQADIQSLRGGSWDEIAGLWQQELVKFSYADPGFLANQMQTVLPVSWSPNFPSKQVLKAIALESPFEGRALKDWAKNIKRADVDRIMAQIRVGMTQQETVDEIVRRVVGRKIVKGKDGVTEVSRRGVEAIVRSAVIHISNQSRREFIEANGDIYSQELFVATLDSRTTPICRSLDGKKFPIGEGPMPPLHMNCRSVRVPIIDKDAIGERPAKPTTEKQLVRQFAEENDLGNVSRRRDLPYGWKGKYDKFARAEIRRQTGQVPATLTYEQWLKSQSREFQDEVLGKTRARLWRKGGLTLTKFVNRKGDQINLDDLARFNRDAFIKAGLDPDDFT